MVLFQPIIIINIFTLIIPATNITAPTTTVVIVKVAPNILPTAINIPSSSDDAKNAVKKSGIPLANAISVTLN